MTIYLPTIRTLALVPPNQKIALVVRHSIRHPIIDSAAVFTTGLTNEGIQVAEEFGLILARYFCPGRVLSSPVSRCLDTASAILRGTNWGGQPAEDDRLSHTYIEKAWQDLPNQPRVPDMREEVLDLVLLLLQVDPSPGLDIYVTHDTVIGVLLGYLMAYPIDPTNWPDFLEGIAIWRNRNHIYAAWRQELYDLSSRFKTR